MRPVSSVRRGPPPTSSLRNTFNICLSSLFSLLERECAGAWRCRRKWNGRPRQEAGVDQCKTAIVARPRAAANGGRVGRRRARSASEPQAPDQRLVARGVDALQIVEQAAARADHHEQAAARMEIFLMRREV